MVFLTKVHPKGVRWSPPRPQLLLDYRSPIARGENQCLSFLNAAAGSCLLPILHRRTNGLVDLRAYLPVNHKKTHKKNQLDIICIEVIGLL